MPLTEDLAAHSESRERKGKHISKPASAVRNPEASFRDGGSVRAKVGQ